MFLKGHVAGRRCGARHNYQVFLGLDVGKDGHHAVALDRNGKRLHDAALGNTGAKLRQVFDGLAKASPAAASMSCAPCSATRPLPAAFCPTSTMTTMTKDQPGEIRPGDIYEDCSFHPVLCTFNDDDQIQGISLIDATMPRACSIGYCAVIKLSIDDVIAARADWPTYSAHRKIEFEEDTGSDG